MIPPMASPAGVAIVGVAMSDRFEIRTELPPSDIVYPVVRDALADAGVSMDDVHSIVSCSQDIYDGRTISSMGVNEVLGGYLRSESKIAGDGLLALLYGAARIVSGEYDLTLVVAHCMESISDLHVVENAAFDPYVQRPLGPDNTVAAALQADRLLQGQRPRSRRRRPRSRRARRSAPPATRARSGAPPTRPPTLRRARRSAGRCASSRAPRSRTAPARSSSPRPSGPATARSGCAGSATRPTRSGPTATLPTRVPCAAPRTTASAQAGLRAADCEVVETAACWAHEQLMHLPALGLDPHADVNPSGGQLGGCPKIRRRARPRRRGRPPARGPVRRTRSCTRRAGSRTSSTRSLSLPGAWLMPDVAIVGTGQTDHTQSRREDVNIPEIVREAVDRALEDARRHVRRDRRRLLREHGPLRGPRRERALARLGVRRRGQAAAQVQHRRHGRYLDRDGRLLPRSRPASTGRILASASRSSPRATRRGRSRPSATRSGSGR